MKKDITLLILAAGMGSRFGGLKQVIPIGPSDEFIIDYSIYDAIKAGFTKVVFLIKEENYGLFKETVGKRVEKHIPVEYCFQKNDNIIGIDLPSDRTKPYGTAHAILCCKDKISENFAIINADDFYGRDAFIKAYNYLRDNHQANKEQYGLVSYQVKNTLTENGAAKRGFCKVVNGKLQALIESKMGYEDGKIIARPLSEAEAFEVQPDDTVSMNFLLFTPSIFDYIEKKMPIFFEKNKDKLDTCEFLIPDLLFEAIKEGYADVEVLPTSANWYGMTFKEDLENVKSSINDLVNRGEYNNPLWNE